LAVVPEKLIASNQAALAMLDVVDSVREVVDSARDRSPSPGTQIGAALSLGQLNA
jgi:hypothetical protein